jgi:EmrB/QacA subfamily drug resistance transporter
MVNTAIQMACDTAQAAGAAPAHTYRRPRWILTATILASSLAFIDGSVVNVGLSAIGKTFHADASDLQWTINAYLLPLGALLLLGGAAGDRYGRTRLLILGTVLFGVASALCAFAPSLAWFLTGRASQGVGSALLMPNSLAILGTNFSGETRGRAIGIWSSVGAAMAAIAPVLGGWLIDTVGWPAIFLINLPVAAGAIVLAVLFIRDTPQQNNPAPLDWLGGLLATAGLGALAWGLTISSGRAGWTDTSIFLTAESICLILGFLLVERARRDDAMMPLDLFRSSSFVGLTLLTLLLYGALGALLILVPYFLIQESGYSGTEAGAALLPFAAVMALASPIFGTIAGKIGSRVPLSIGALTVAAGFLLLLRVQSRVDYWTEVFPAVLVIALGMAGSAAPLTVAVLGSVDSRHTGSASGLNSAVARTAGMIATALLGGILGTSGSMLMSGFRTVALVCAFAAICASLSIFFLLSAGQARAEKGTNRGY